MTPCLVSFVSFIRKLILVYSTLLGLRHVEFMTQTEVEPSLLRLKLSLPTQGVRHVEAPLQVTQNENKTFRFFKTLRSSWDNKKIQQSEYRNTCPIKKLYHVYVSSSLLDFVRGTQIPL